MAFSPLGGFAFVARAGRVATFGTNVSNVILGNQGILQFSIMNSTGTSGVDYSRIKAPSATVNITALAVAPFTIQLVSVNPATGQLGLANFNDTMSYSWILLSALSVNNFSANKFTIDDTTDFTNALGGGSSSIAEVGGNSLVLSFIVRPRAVDLVQADGDGALRLGAAARRRRR